MRLLYQKSRKDHGSTGFLKGNQENLSNAIRDLFNSHFEDDFAQGRCRRHETRDKSHGRIDERYYYLAIAF